MQKNSYTTTLQQYLSSVKPRRSRLVRKRLVVAIPLDADGNYFDLSSSVPFLNTRVEALPDDGLTLSFDGFFTLARADVILPDGYHPFRTHGVEYQARDYTNLSVTNSYTMQNRLIVDVTDWGPIE